MNKRQIWVDTETREEIKKLARKERLTMQNFLKKKICEGKRYE
jgi:hypothetical protein